MEDISDIIVEILRQAEPDLDSRLKYQAEALSEDKCTSPLIGKWIDANHVQYLFAAFALNDADFAEYFPKMAHVTEHHRKRITKTFEHHFDHCKHCSLKRGYDLELDSRIERTFRENRDHLLRQLKPEQAKTSIESDHAAVAVTVTAGE